MQLGPLHEEHHLYSKENSSRLKQSAIIFQKKEVGVMNVSQYLIATYFRCKDNENSVYAIIWKKIVTFDAIRSEYKSIMSVKSDYYWPFD